MIEAGIPIKILVGLHSGCLELMAHEGINKITYLKGKRVGVDSWHSQMLRARKIGHSILDTKIDRPWSNYYCCTLAGSGDYASKYPVATKRVLRAILKSIDLCGSAPQAVARQLVDRGLVDNYELLAQSLTAIGYDRWRNFDTDDAIRFYTLRMREVGMSKADPINIIADGTNWQFLNEIKRELKT
jgi:NitT/TauT family transport system substrate-binding protein